jgi:predicted metal-dependent peptidase
MSGSSEDHFISGEVAEEHDDSWEDEADHGDNKEQGMQELSKKPVTHKTMDGKGSTEMTPAILQQLRQHRTFSVLRLTRR